MKRIISASLLAAFIAILACLAARADTPFAPGAVLTPVQGTARLDVMQASANLGQLIGQTHQGLQNCWNNPNWTPQQYINTLGNKAATVFAANNAIVALQTQLKAALSAADFAALVPQPVTADDLALIKPFTVNADGTITVNP